VKGRRLLALPDKHQECLAQYIPKHGPKPKKVSSLTFKAPRKASDLILPRSELVARLLTLCPSPYEQRKTRSI
jgi:hypothetical protein